MENSKGLQLPDASVLVESISKVKKGTKAKSVSVFLAPGIDLPTGGGGYKNVDTLPPISEADDSMFYILPDGSLNYIKNNEWQTVSATNGDTKWIISGGYYPEYSITTDVEFSENCTITIVDSSKMESFFAEYPSQWGYNFNFSEEYDPETGEPTGNSFWNYYWDEGVLNINQEDLLSTTGISAALDDPEMPWAYFSLAKTFSVNTEIRGSLSEHYVSLEDLCGDNEQSIVHLSPINDGDEYLEIPKGVFNSVVIRNDSPLMPVVTPYEFCNNFTRVDMLDLNNLPIVLGRGNLMNVGVKPEALSPAISMRTPVISGLSSDARVSRYYWEGLSTSNKTIVGAINELVGGGGGGGVTYSFNNTSDGWEVNGSDGSYFSHTDGGGSGDVSYQITVKWVTGEFTKTHTVTTENCTVVFGDEESKDKIVGAFETESGWKGFHPAFGEFDPNSGDFDTSITVTTIDSTKRAMFRVNTEVTYSNPEEHETTYTATDLQSLCGTDTYNINGEEIPAHAITSITIATDAKTISETPYNFCCNLINLEQIFWKRIDGELHDGDQITIERVHGPYFSNTKLASGEYGFNGLGYLNVLKYENCCFIGTIGPESYPRTLYVLQNTKKVGRDFCAFCTVSPASKNGRIVLEEAGDYFCAGTNIDTSNYTFPDLYRVEEYAFAYCSTATSGGIVLPGLMVDSAIRLGYGIENTNGYAISIPNMPVIPIGMCTKAKFSTNPNSATRIRFNPYTLMTKYIPECFKNCQGYFGVDLSGSGYSYDSGAFATEDATALMYTHGVEWSGTATPPTDSSVSPYRKIIQV